MGVNAHIAEKSVKAKSFFFFFFFFWGSAVVRLGRRGRRGRKDE